jgi:hypothetical protein
MGTEKSLLNRIVTWAVIGILAIVALKIAGRLLAFVMGLAGMVFGIALFLIFTVAPIVLLGWLAVKGWRAFAKEPAT